VLEGADLEVGDGDVVDVGDCARGGIDEDEAVGHGEFLL